MKSIKVFISQKMKGLSDDDISEERYNIKKEVDKKLSLYDLDVEFIDSFFQEDIDKTAGVVTDPVYWLGKSLQLLSTADLLVYPEEFTIADSKGVAVEVNVASVYGIHHFYYKQLENNEVVIPVVLDSLMEDLITKLYGKKNSDKD